MSADRLAFEDVPVAAAAAPTAKTTHDSQDVNKRVVTFCVRPYHHGKAKKPKQGDLLVISVLGNTTLDTVADILFDNYLIDRLDGETLNSHLWRFSPLDNTDLST